MSQNSYHIPKKWLKFECRFSQANMLTLHMFAFITSMVMSFKGPFKMCILALTKWSNTLNHLVCLTLLWGWSLKGYLMYKFWKLRKRRDKLDSVKQAGKGVSNTIKLPFFNFNSIPDVSLLYATAIIATFSQEKLQIIFEHNQNFI